MKPRQTSNSLMCATTLKQGENHLKLIIYVCLEMMSLTNETQTYSAPSVSGSEICPLKAALQSFSWKVIY